MKTDKKTACVSLWLLCIIVVSIELQYSWGFYLGVGTLTGIVLFREDTIALICVTTSYIIVFPGPHTGYLYGRDAHDAARIATGISDQGWPIEEMIGVSGFEQTPGVHFLSVIVSRLTGLPIYPSVEHRLLATYIFPIFLTGAILVLAYLIPRRLTKKPNVAFLSVALWVPLFEFLPTVHRTTPALVGGSIVMFLSICTSVNWRFKLIIVLSSMLAIVSHHFTAAMTIFIATLYRVSLYLHPKVVARIDWNDIYDTVDRPPSHRENTNITFMLTIGALFFIWYLYQTEAIRFAVAITVRIAADLAVQDAAVTEIKQGFDQSLAVQFRLFFGKFLYQFILAVPIVAGIAKSRTFDQNDPFVLAFGIFSFVWSLIVWQLGIIAFRRILNFFILFGSWKFLQNARRLTGGDSLTIQSFEVYKLFVVFLLAVSLVTIPPYIVSDDEPAYSDLERNQRFSPQVYAVADYIETHGTYDSVIGDWDIWETISPTVRIPWTVGYPEVVNGDIPDDHIVVLTERNTELYYGEQAGVNVKLADPKVYNSSITNNKVHTTGKFDSFVGYEQSRGAQD